MRDPKKLSVTLVALVLLPLATTHSEEVSICDDAVECLFESIETGDYSVLEPWLSTTMKVAFSEHAFRAFRAQLISKYGLLRGYALQHASSESGFHVELYKAFFDRGTLTFKVVLNPSTELIEGLWIVSAHETNGAEGLLESATLFRLNF